MKTLVTYFSAEAGVTKSVAEKIAKATDGTSFEITPKNPYTEADLKWVNPFSRCNREKLGRKDVPVAKKVEDFKSYDVVYIGFPIWYGAAPNVVNTFCQDYKWFGKKVVLFATSGGSGIGKSAEKLAPYIEGADIVADKLIKNGNDVEELVNSVCFA